MVSDIMSFQYMLAVGLFGSNLFWIIWFQDLSKESLMDLVLFH